MFQLTGKSGQLKKEPGAETIEEPCLLALSEAPCLASFLIQTGPPASKPSATLPCQSTVKATLIDISIG